MAVELTAHDRMNIEAMAAMPWPTLLRMVENPTENMGARVMTLSAIGLKANEELAGINGGLEALASLKAELGSIMQDAERIARGLKDNQEEGDEETRPC